MPEIEIRTYVDARDRAPFEEWVLGLDRHAQARIIIALARLECGNTSNVKPVGEGVSEFKMYWGPGYRVYFGQDGPTLVILLCGGNKARQSDDIATAKLRWADYRERKAARER